MRKITKTDPNRIRSSGAQAMMGYTLLLYAYWAITALFFPNGNEVGLTSKDTVAMSLGRGCVMTLSAMGLDCPEGNCPGS